MTAISYIDDHPIENKRVLLRVDCNLSMNPDHTIADDARMKQVLPTITNLLAHGNRLILLTHLGRPQGRDESLSIKPIAERLQTYIPQTPVTVIDDFTTQQQAIADALTQNHLVMLENIRYYTGEDANDPAFAKQLASLAEVYVNDAFSVSHRAAASIVGITEYLPSFGGLLLKKEVTMLTKAITNPAKPVVAILGGSKISTKLKLITKLTTIADHVLLGGGLANTLFLAEGKEIGKSIAEKDAIASIQNLVTLAKEHATELVLPTDVAVGDTENESATVKQLDDLQPSDNILDIGPETEALFGSYIAYARTIVWNGPVGYFENQAFRRGTDFIYYAITTNADAFSVVGGGETLSAVNNHDYLDKISHISTAGGAMLEFIENGTLPGLEALKAPAH